MANRKKLDVSEAKRNDIKQNFESINKSSLKGDALKYYTLVENGKRSAKNNLRFEGRYLGGEIVPIIRKVAERKEIPVQEYLNQNRSEVIGLIHRGYTTHERAVDATIDTIASQRRKTLEVDDGNGANIMRKEQAMENLAKLQQFAATNTHIVALAPKVRLYKSGLLRVTVPPPEVYENMNAEQFKQMLDDLGIFYVESPPKK